MRAPDTYPEPTPVVISRASALIPPPIPPDPAASDICWPLRWPRRDGLELGAYRSAVPCARTRAREILREWQLGSLTEAAMIAVSELVTNACLITRAEKLGTPVRLWMLGSSMRLMVMVWDASIQPPVLRDAGDLAENGRGLTLVQAITIGDFDSAISGRWGHYFPAAGYEDGGKVVWIHMQVRR